MSRFEAYLGRIWEQFSAKAPAQVGIHWGVFQLTDEHRDEPRELFLETVARQGGFSARRGVARCLLPA